jgi:hypothetical protein
LFASNLNEVLGIQFNWIATWEIRETPNAASMSAKNFKGKMVLFKIIEYACMMTGDTWASAPTKFRKIPIYYGCFSIASQGD